jgi:hypothetical protein
MLLKQKTKPRPIYSWNTKNYKTNDFYRSNNFAIRKPIIDNILTIFTILDSKKLELGRI